jgi:hypothetical protein
MIEETVAMIIIKQVSIGVILISILAALLLVIDFAVFLEVFIIV